MHVVIRKLSGSQYENVLIPISKANTIMELRKLIHNKMNVAPEQQMLVFMGKQLVDEHLITDYGIQNGYTIQMIVRQQKLAHESDTSPKSSDASDNTAAHSSKDNADDKGTEDDEKRSLSASDFYKVGDYVDVQLVDSGAWYEAEIVTITKKCSEKDSSDNNLIFTVKSAPHVIEFEVDVTFDDIRPRSYHTYTYSELKKDMVVLANYNLEQPNSLGLWYDFRIQDLSRTKINGVILLGRDKAPIEKCCIKLKDEIMRIEKPVLAVDRSKEHVTYIPRKYPANCTKCHDNQERKCRECGCRICAGKEDWANIILCDECNFGYHLSCLNPPLESVPDEEYWYCPECKIDESQIVKPGEKLKESKKKEKMPSKQNKSGRDWGRGMACVGRSKECTIVPKNHFGPIPGIEVGTRWRYRFQAAEAGVHRPQVAGIHGRDGDGAYSICLSGGYEDDIDDGEEFLYTGSGGRDLSGNKRSNDQSSDQELTRTNKALALNCDASLNKDGAEARDWRKGKPVRVLRNWKLQKHSKYAPKEGIRYDGIYKVVKYYKVKGLSGFYVWRYLLRRDDQTPAPWEENGQEFDVIYPPNYHEALALEQEVKENNASTKNSKHNKNKPSQGKMTSPKKAKQDTKRKTNTLDSFLSGPSPKKAKIAEYKIPVDIEQIISSDEDNSKLWKECKEFAKKGKQAFLQKVEETFMCVCCQEVVHLPVTTECKHNICKGCFQRSFRCQIYSCPFCRYDFGEKYRLAVNETLGQALKMLFPGYDVGR
ncbi:unnamed protein product [Acanthoscelides obtectus]|uniref:RING-type E3 ubiquitin transferase n=1 Tax=Acanthoscelides obtectus TaxID=200917 RepID=A0A9P0M164_ACAOB|nr:unnamed protein product [Acanthoscelides obtectus]CAK1682199.1 E3 ubiquitin-protein ligase UHRF1 [Acanthoscelides obtectus]